MRAAVVDVGSNTLRMVVGECRNGTFVPLRYERDVVRLAGDFTPRNELARASMERALVTLRSFRNILENEHIATVRVIGTAALRRATNSQAFIDQLAAETGLKLEIISGDEEAQLTTQGVLSVIHPAVEDAIIVDIGGGSTELICIVGGTIRFQKSYPIGVVKLCEEFATQSERKKVIASAVDDFFVTLKELNLNSHPYQFIGTAGTVTTLAAIDLQLREYDASKINNHKLSVTSLYKLKEELKQLSAVGREALAGMEKGRGDLILHGLEIVLSVMEKYHFTALIVADAGLLEGALLKLCSTNSD